MTSHKWFQDLISETNGTHFEQIPDLFKVTVHKGNDVYAEWDITNDLRENGMAWRNFTNASLNVDAEFIFMHEALKEQLKDVDSFQKIMEKTLNDSAKFNNITTTVHHYSSWDGLYLRYYIHAALTLLVGLVGLALKLTAPEQTTVVRVTRKSHSIWFIMMGILMAVHEYSRYRAFLKSGESVSELIYLILIGGIASVLLKVLMTSLKVFTFLIYIFQNTMLYRPFFFRKHKKSLSKWLLRMSLVQSAALFVGLIVWSMNLMFNYDDDCAGVNDRSERWQIAVTSTIVFGYIGSLSFSIIFTVGYYCNRIKNIRKSEAKSFKRMMLSSLIEILFDFAVPIVHVASPLNLIAFDPKPMGLYQAHYMSAKCDMLTRLQALDCGLSDSTIGVLVLQPTLQELFYLIFKLIDLCREKRSNTTVETERSTRIQ